MFSITRLLKPSFVKNSVNVVNLKNYLKNDIVYFSIFSVKNSAPKENINIGTIGKLIVIIGTIPLTIYL